ncbi:hypothetical protein EJV47_14695 [Hymenobacter gummosus]|uniref:Outer membrane protein beta-barrel domain-containing protein n=1 Tax=Hymenobacter gummosus TaxID=1776032 RepID=A0A3S0J965_9BACT|nr:hypothetical protein [Hymenobacter gummosus]RTQ48844.1 hypothetical protein EJV47_14695 [Hymenobacter gummosus]
MNPPETDPFYDALRGRLHDYEEPLPAGGWAGISPQLPPARPQPWWRRPASRRLAAVAAVLVLLLPITALLWYQQQAPQAERPATARHQANGPAPAPENAPAARRRTGAAAPVAQADTRTVGVPAPSRPAPVAAEAGRTPAEEPTAPKHLARQAARPQSVAGRPINDSEAAALISSATPSKRRPRRGAALLLLADNSTRRRSTSFATERAASGSATTFSQPSARAAQPPAGPETRTRQAASAADYPGAVGVAAQPLSTGAPDLAAVTAAPETAAQPGSVAGLNGQSAALMLPPAEALPAPLAPVSPADSLRRPRPARLSLGLLLGLAPARRGAGTMPPQLRQLEHPGLSRSAELAARYQVAPGVLLRSGVGYARQQQRVAFTLEQRQKYWARTSQLVVSNNPGGPDTLQVVSYAERDSVLSRRHQEFRLRQHYLTLPLYAEWRPQLHPRWQPVLSLGATLHWLLQGRYLAATDQGCHCQEQTQRGSGAGPLRPASVGLSAGLGLDYALGLRTTLLLRPSAHYWLTPTARAGGARPLGLGLQVGVLFDAHRP